jgi:hypothetical protein
MFLCPRIYISGVAFPDEEIVRWCRAVRVNVNDFPEMIVELLCSWAIRSVEAIFERHVEHMVGRENKSGIKV